MRKNIPSCSNSALIDTSYKWKMGKIFVDFYLNLNKIWKCTSSWGQKLGTLGSTMPVITVPTNLECGFNWRVHTLVRYVPSVKSLLPVHLFHRLHCLPLGKFSLCIGLSGLSRCNFKSVFWRVGWNYGQQKIYQPWCPQSWRWRRPWTRQLLPSAQLLERQLQPEIPRERNLSNLWLG